MAGYVGLFLREGYEIHTEFCKPENRNMETKTNMKPDLWNYV
jgi:hypothetical protein